jgi:hypothetical protein
MKLKILPLLLMFMFVLSSVQPITANPEIGDTKIEGIDGNPLKDVIVQTGTPINLHARLCLYKYWDNFLPVGAATWNPTIFRYLDFYVYHANPDGTNGNIFWSTTAITSLYTANANPGELIINHRGNYNLVVKYEGNLKHCNATAKIYVV